jgi:hypothetical protein
VIQKHVARTLAAPPGLPPPRQSCGCERSWCIWPPWLKLAIELKNAQTLRTQIEDKKEYEQHSRGKKHGR